MELQRRLAPMQQQSERDRQQMLEFQAGAVIDRRGPTAGSYTEMRAYMRGRGGFRARRVSFLVGRPTPV